jgi:hypothetical protein
MPSFQHVLRQPAEQNDNNTIDNRPYPSKVQPLMAGTPRPQRSARNSVKSTTPPAGPPKVEVCREALQAVQPQLNPVRQTTCNSHLEKLRSWESYGVGIPYSKPFSKFSGPACSLNRIEICNIYKMLIVSYLYPLVPLLPNISSLVGANRALSTS